MAETVTLTDLRSNTREKPVWQAVFSQMTWASGGHAKVTSATAGINGEIKQIICTPTQATSVADLTFDVNLYDTNDVLIAQLAAALDDEAGSTLYSQSDFSTAALVDGFYLTVDPNKDPSTNGTAFDITVRGT